MVVTNELKENLRVTPNNLNKILLPVIVLDLPSISTYIQPNYNYQLIK